MPGGPLNINAPNATVMAKAHFRSVVGEWVPTAARKKIHTALLARWRTDSQPPPQERKATLFAGPPAAGKSTLMGAPGTHLGEHRRIDADDFKTLLLEAAVLDGSIWNLLPEALRHNRTGQFHPFELSALVHHESTILHARALSEAMRAGENIAIDGTLGYMPWARELAGQLRDFGYKIHVIDVEATRELSLERVVGRWRTGYENALARPGDPKAAMGGRWLPTSAVSRLFTPGQARSHCEVNALEIATSFSEVVKYDLYRASDRPVAPKREQSWSRTGSGEWTSP
ncbi:zeta toxin family protein [Rhodococcus fascians]|uniref:zeta toxin family protein n=1 Tax=Rhodococcoides fascians TaxID=1828 RepID=UPI0024B70AAF|nr:zeta toxin family protein [Rhodococcus fascians]MDJ0004864.1 zeta toxin family protein [Rhodococcus fascians]